MKRPSGQTMFIFMMFCLIVRIPIHLFIDHPASYLFDIFWMVASGIWVFVDLAPKKRSSGVNEVSLNRASLSDSSREHLRRYWEQTAPVLAESPEEKANRIWLRAIDESVGVTVEEHGGA